MEATWLVPIFGESGASNDGVRGRSVQGTILFQKDCIPKLTFLFNGERLFVGRSVYYFEG